MSGYAALTRPTQASINGLSVIQRALGD